MGIFKGVQFNERYVRVIAFSVVHLQAQKKWKAENNQGVQFLLECDVILQFTWPLS